MCRFTWIIFAALLGGCGEIGVASEEPSSAGCNALAEAYGLESEYSSYVRLEGHERFGEVGYCQLYEKDCRVDWECAESNGVEACRPEGCGDTTKSHLGRSWICAWEDCLEGDFSEDVGEWVEGNIGDWDGETITETDGVTQ